jgi:hypothetical protein
MKDEKYTSLISAQMGQTIAKEVIKMCSDKAASFLCNDGHNDLSSFNWDKVLKEANIIACTKSSVVTKNLP